MMMMLMKVVGLLLNDVPHRGACRVVRDRARGRPEARVAAEGRAGRPRRDHHGARAGGQRRAVQVAAAAAHVVVAVQP